MWLSDTPVLQTRIRAEPVNPSLARLELRNDRIVRLISFIDSGLKSRGKSPYPVSEYVIELGNNPVGWTSKQQAVVALPSCEVVRPSTCRPPKPQRKLYG